VGFGIAALVHVIGMRIRYPIAWETARKVMPPSLAHTYVHLTPKKGVEQAPK
jgi:hypothetical protein